MAEPTATVLRSLTRLQFNVSQGCGFIWWPDGGELISKIIHVVRIQFLAGCWLDASFRSLAPEPLPRIAQNMEAGFLWRKQESKTGCVRQKLQSLCNQFSEGHLYYFCHILSSRSESPDPIILKGRITALHGSLRGRKPMDDRNKDFQMMRGHQCWMKLRGQVSWEVKINLGV